MTDFLDHELSVVRALFAPTPEQSHAIMMQRERNMLCMQLAARPSAVAVWDAMTDRAQDERAMHRDSMIDVLRTVGGLR
jgi:hypothetical protein